MRGLRPCSLGTPGAGQELRRAEEAPAELFSDLLCRQEKADRPPGEASRVPKGKASVNEQTYPDDHSGLKAGPSP